MLPDAAERWEDGADADGDRLGDRVSGATSGEAAAWIVRGG